MKFRGVGAVPKASADSLLPAQPSARLQPAEAADTLAGFLVERINGSTEEYRRCQNAAQQRLDACGSPHAGTTVHLEGALQMPARALLPPDEEGYARLRRLDTSLRMIEAAFPQVSTDVELCRLTCLMLEGAWRSRALVPPREEEQTAACACPLCRQLPTPPHGRWVTTAGGRAPVVPSPRRPGRTAGNSTAS